MTSAMQVPEPSTWILCSIACIGFAAVYKNRKPAPKLDLQP
ncbi:MAG: PEP-CTERM sorting domain-containing protein [Planctomycetota bacterium]|nr:MAG: PEP-CTERM sorting domain-containing protein [Planctomycetota bacterium]